MAALPLCASWFPPSGVAVAPRHSARPASSSRVTTHIHSLLGRRGPSPLPIRIKARTRASHSLCPKAAADRDRDHGLEPQPEPERGDDDEPDAAASTDSNPSNNSYDILERRKFRKAFCAAWLPEAPDMFRMEKDEISNYTRNMRICSPTKMQALWNKGMALFVCAVAQEALDLASMVMDLTYIESLQHGTIQLFDQNTANQVIRMCTPTFCHVAKAACLKSIDTDTVVSFLDALRRLVVFCDMLFLQIVFKLKDGPLKSSISSTMGTHSRKFDKKMRSLKEQLIQLIQSRDATGIKHPEVMYTFSRVMEHTQSYILQMIPHWSLLGPCLEQEYEYARRNLDGSK